MAQERLYTVKEVSQLTGIPPATLRKWEQRYQVVSPARLPNGYRGYTAQDLKVLRRVNALVQDGTPVSLAVEAARRPDAPQPVADTVEMNQGARYRDALLRSLTAVDETGARRVMDEAFAVLQVEQVLRSVLEPVLREIGQLWAAGTISEYQEHFASVLIRDRLSALRALLPPGVGPHLITACLPGELHEIGTLIVTILALRRGFQVTHLSGSPSPEGLKRAVRELRPDAVLLSVTML
ncbi:MAG TPA: MerR family transcriptional regulator, partial [Symbiobacteriaceae bacterium]|nr:MerR family transcriptional regulator [Symbiobacteriaceae bacterium]